MASIEHEPLEGAFSQDGYFGGFKWQAPTFQAERLLIFPYEAEWLYPGYGLAWSGLLDLCKSKQNDYTTRQFPGALVWNTEADAGITGLYFGFQSSDQPRTAKLDICFFETSQKVRSVVLLLVVGMGPY